ncbi:MAG: hypothetical protein ACLR5G_05045 [Eubacteriales bacterium]
MTLRDGENVYSIPRDAVSKAKTVFDF